MRSPTPPPPPPPPPPLSTSLPLATFPPVHVHWGWSAEDPVVLLVLMRLCRLFFRPLPHTIVGLLWQTDPPSLLPFQTAPRTSSQLPPCPTPAPPTAHPTSVLPAPRPPPLLPPSPPPPTPPPPASLPTSLPLATLPPVHVHWGWSAEDPVVRLVSMRLCRLSFRPLPHTIVGLLRQTDPPSLLPFQTAPRTSIQLPHCPTPAPPTAHPTSVLPAPRSPPLLPPLPPAPTPPPPAYLPTSLPLATLPPVHVHWGWSAEDPVVQLVSMRLCRLSFRQRGANPTSSTFFFATHHDQADLFTSPIVSPHRARHAGRPGPPTRGGGPPHHHQERAAAPPQLSAACRRTTTQPCAARACRSAGGHWAAIRPRG